MGNLQPKKPLQVDVPDELSDEEAGYLAVGLVTLAGVFGSAFYYGNKLGNAAGEKAERAKLEDQLKEVRGIIDDQNRKYSDERLENRRRNKELMEEVDDLRRLVKEYTKNQPK